MLIVINDKSRERSIPKATQDKINKAMRELGYKPNLSARRLKILAQISCIKF